MVKLTASSMTLQAKFDLFRQRIEPTENERQNVIKSHTYLSDNILKRLDYVQNTFLTGSYKKRTIIRPMNDVDVFVVLTHSMNDFYTPCPQVILNKLKRDLQVKYPNSTIRQDKPCIVLDFNHCKFELTPTLESGSQWTGKHYKIPDPDNINNWKFIGNSPEQSAKKITAANSQNQKLIPLIKMMKRCKLHNNIKEPASFEMERLAIQRLPYIRTYREGVTHLLRIYGWYDDNTIRKLQRLSDSEFAQFCGKNLFDNDFPS